MWLLLQVYATMLINHTRVIFVLGGGEVLVRFGMLYGARCAALPFGLTAVGQAVVAFRGL